MKTIAEQIKWDFKTNGDLVIRDKNGNLIYREYSNGCWTKREYDSKGREIYFETSKGVIYNNRPNPPSMKPDPTTNPEYKLPVVFFMGIKVIRYRIVRDRYSGFECQKWRLWFPFWIQMGYSNTHSSIEKAISYIKNDKTVVLSS